MKTLIKRTLLSLGISLHRHPPGIVTGDDLIRDLGLVIGSEPGACCIDVGANDGGTIDLLRSALISPRIHAFEPNPETFKRLQLHYGRATGVRLVNAGVGEQPSTLALHTVANHHLNSFLPLTDTGRAVLQVPDQSRTIDVLVMTLDDYASAQQLEYIHLLKIDTQGFELHVLRGGATLFERRQIGAVLIELNFAPLYAGQARATAVIDYLHNFGLELVDFYEKCRQNPLLGWCTALFTRAENPR